jgi:hypothetical protein
MLHGFGSGGGGHSFKGLDPLKYIHGIGFVKLFALLQFVYIMFSHRLNRVHSNFSGWICM